MNRAVINKNINEHNSDTDKELQHGPGHLGTDKSIGIPAPDTSFDNIEGKQRHRCKNDIADHE